MALKKFQFLFIKIYRLIIVRIFFPILIFQRNFYLQILTYERILQTLFLHIFRHYLQCTFYVAAFFTYYFHSISPSKWHRPLSYRKHYTAFEKFSQVAL